MPSPTPSAPYIYPRVNADGTGLEWVSVSEILDDLAGLSARAGQRYLIDTSALATENYAAAVGQAILQGSVAATAAGSVALQGASSANAGGSSVIAFPGAASAGGSASIGTVQFQTLASALGSAAVQTSLVATAAGSLVLMNSAYTAAVGSGVVLGTVVAQSGGSAAIQMPAATAQAYGSATLSSRLAATAGGSGVLLLVAKGTATGSAVINAAIGVNHYAQGTASAGDEVLWVRRSASSPYSGYFATGYDDGYDYWLAVYVTNGTSSTWLWTGGFASGLWRLEANGTTIRFLVNGSVLYSGTNSMYDTGAPAGFGFADFTSGSL